MIRVSINLPAKRRLYLQLVKRRKSSDDIPLLPDMGSLLRIKKGSRISRLFRHIFEHKKISRILGTNLALLTLTSTLIPSNSIVFSGFDESTTTQTPIVLTTKKGVRYPLDKVKISQGYKFYHPAIDFDGITGDPVYPIASGLIKAVQYSNFGYGNAILINHGSNTTSLYAHLSKINVHENDKVTTSTIIGELGSTGRASGDHLHLEVHENAQFINPLSILEN